MEKFLKQTDDREDELLKSLYSEFRVASLKAKLAGQMIKLLRFQIFQTLCLRGRRFSKKTTIKVSKRFTRYDRFNGLTQYIT